MFNFFKNLKKKNLFVELHSTYKNYTSDTCYLNWWLNWIKQAQIEIKYINDNSLLFSHPLAFFNLVVSKKKFLVGFDLWDKYPLFTSDNARVDNVLASRWNHCALFFKTNYFDANSPYRYRAPVSYVTKEADEGRLKAEEAYNTENIFPAGMPLNNGQYFLKNKYKALRSDEKEHDIFWTSTNKGFCRVRKEMSSKLSTKYPNFSEFLSYDKFLKRLAKTKICIDFPSNSRVTFRTSEALAIGSALIGPPVCNIYPQEFRLEECMVVCKADLSDFLDKIEYYLTHDTERQELSDFGMNCWDNVMSPKNLSTYWIETSLDYLESKNLV